MLINVTNYQSNLSLTETQIAIKLVKDTFEKKLAQNLSLIRVSAPLFVDPKTGLNDNLSGKERPVSFDILESGKVVEIVHSLAKWKRMALGKYQINLHEGLYTDMNAIRRDEETDNLHSLYVDQWDWEKVITNEDRNIDYLKETVDLIYKALLETVEVVQKTFPVLKREFNDKVFYINSEELLKMYPNLSSQEREKEICKKYGTVFIIGIGDRLSNGLPHDLRAPDYDDWTLNGDLLIYDNILEKSVELSSMGIRVNNESIIKQLEKANAYERKSYPFHQSIIKNKLPLSIGGGIGQSRICLIVLEKAHIGEVQVSEWKEEDIVELKKMNVELL